MKGEKTGISLCDYSYTVKVISNTSAHFMTLACEFGVILFYFVFLTLPLNRTVRYRVSLCTDGSVSAMK